MKISQKPKHRANHLGLLCFITGFNHRETAPHPILPRCSPDPAPRTGARPPPGSTVCLRSLGKGVAISVEFCALLTLLKAVACQHRTPTCASSSPVPSHSAPGLQAPCPSDTPASLACHRQVCALECFPPSPFSHLTFLGQLLSPLRGWVEASLPWEGSPVRVLPALLPQVLRTLYFPAVASGGIPPTLSTHRSAQDILVLLFPGLGQWQLQS